jgi:hypothetical protein
LQRQGQGHGFDGIHRNVNPAAVAGTTFGTDNVVWVPVDNPATALIYIGDQFLIFFERFQFKCLGISTT